MTNQSTVATARYTAQLIGIAAMFGTVLPPTALAAPTRLVYTSVFDQYRPYDDPAVQSWRQANETVTRIGGWRSYLKESQSVNSPAASGAPASPTTPAAPKAPSTSSSPVADPHAGHRKQP
jgi:hypothetical protein